MKTAVDLFAGAGGFSIGLQDAGFKVVLAVEWVEDFACTLANHVDPANIVVDDVRSVNFEQAVDRVDLVVGGPPCQPFSSGGLREGADDDRDMLPAFIDAVDQLQPKAFIMENVRGLTVGKRKEYLNQALRKLEAIGYFVNHKVVNAAHFGVPQKRKRLFVVGMRGSKFEFPSPTHGPGCQYDFLTVRDALPEEQLGEPNTSKITFAKNPSIRPSPYHGQLFNGGGRPLNLNEPAPTLLASAGGNKTHFIDEQDEVPPYHEHLRNGGNPKKGQLEHARRLTVRESAILQTFPADMKFCGSKSKQYTQIGNAVPPKLAKILANEVYLQYRGAEKKSPKLYYAVQSSLFQ